MNSVQQIIENVMKEVIKIVTHDKNDGLKTMAKEMQTTVNNAVLKVLQLTLSEIDEEIFFDKKLRNDWEIVRKNDKKTIMTCVGELEYKRRYYRNKESKKYKYLLDDWLGITSHQKIGDDVREDLIQSSLNVSYQKSGKESAPKPVSKTSVGRYISEVDVDCRMQSNGKKRKCKNLYVEADEDHVPLQNGRNVQVRLIYVHEGNISDTKRAKLGHVRYLTWPIGGNTDDMWEAVMTYIQEQYDTDKLERIWLSGDGAGWIQRGSEWLIKCQMLLDSYHINKRFMSFTAQVPHLRSYGRNILKSGTHEQLKILYEHAYEKAETKSKKKQVTDDYRYFIKHWEHINNKRIPQAPGCSAESHVSHVLSARLSSRPMGWSKTNLEQMAAMRVMHANGIPIVYERASNNKLSKLPTLPNDVLSTAKVRMNSNVDDGIKNVIPPIVATGSRTPTYIALRGLALGKAIV